MGGVRCFDCRSNSSLVPDGHSLPEETSAEIYEMKDAFEYIKNQMKDSAERKAGCIYDICN